MAKKQRSDADRRVRQCERLGRLLRLLHLIMGKGRWDAATLADELECSRRTVFRFLQTLSMAGVPWYFDESSRSYRVRPGFRFPYVEPPTSAPPTSDMKVSELLRNAISEGEAVLANLHLILKLVGNAD